MLIISITALFLSRAVSLLLKLTPWKIRILSYTSTRVNNPFNTIPWYRRGPFLLARIRIIG
jgi:hypothetical protein